MGCVKSKIDSDEVQLCQIRKQLIKNAVTSRHALASNHTSYVTSLRNVGTAIKQFEIVSADPPSAPPVALLPLPAPPVSLLPLPAPPVSLLPLSAPPQPPGFERNPLQRALSLPIVVESVSSKDHLQQAVAEESEDYYTDKENHGIPELEDVPDSRSQSPIPSPQMSPRAQRNLSDILTDIDKCFLNSYTEGRSVSHLHLHAQKTLTHMSSPRDGNLVHHQRVSRMLSWSKSPQGNDEQNGVDNLASILDKLQAWEKKLYDETRGLETTVRMLKKKERHLEKRLQRGPFEGQEEAKYAIHILKTKSLVENESIEQTKLEIRKLRDQQLFPLLLEFLNALKQMWNTMHKNHQRQANLTTDLMRLKPDVDLNIKGECREITIDLKKAVDSWRDHLEAMVKSERNWMEAMSEWSRRQNGNDVLGSSQVIAYLERLCKEWSEMLRNISYEKVTDSLDKFTNILHDMVMKQNDESESLKKTENLQRDIEKKKQALEKLESKSRLQSMNSGEMPASQHPLHVKKVIIQLLERQLQEEREIYHKLQSQNRAMMLACLQQGLPNVLNSIRDFSENCMTSYERLYEGMKECNPSLRAQGR